MSTNVQKITLSPSRDIPFNKLLLSQSNVRRVKAGVSVEELAGDIARREVPTCHLTDRIGDVRERMRVAAEQACIVVNEEGVVLGRVRGAALAADARATAEAVMGPARRRSGRTRFWATLPRACTGAG